GKAQESAVVILKQRDRERAADRAALRRQEVELAGQPLPGSDGCLMQQSGGTLAVWPAYEIQQMAVRAFRWRRAQQLLPRRVGVGDGAHAVGGKSGERQAIEKRFVWRGAADLALRRLQGDEKCL